MGDLANGHACDAFILAFANDIVTRFRSTLLDQTFGEKVRYYVMADTNWEVRLYASVATGTGSEEAFILADTPIFCPTSDDIIEQTAEVLDLDEEKVERRLDTAALVEPDACTDPACFGWTFDWMGIVHACVCGRFASDADAVVALRAFVKNFPVSEQDGQCSPTCRGWDIFDREGSQVFGTYIDRCDDCDIFPPGDAAFGAAVAWILERRAERAAGAADGRLPEAEA